MDAVTPAWRDPRTDPPFNHRTESRQPHGPYDLLLRDGAEICASWGHGTTGSGGRAWGWKCSDGRLLAFEAPAGWREVSR